MPPPIVTTFLVLTVILVLLPAEVSAFGAGDIPDFSYLEGKAFRHGDIENTLLELVKAVGHSQGGGLLGLAKGVLHAATGGKKFSKEDVKRVYFGNWLRDYSQAMDIAGLSKLSADTITLIVGILGFLEFGFATNEYEVTQDRLGVYLPVEHIDNPRGYAEKEGDARKYNQKLRPPVDPRELEIDSHTGMKNYMATENRGWDTSTAFIRRTLHECIRKGRNADGKEGAELWETYRLLGQGLHTLEDFTAHSNWVEIALRKLGHSEVFCHVGDNVFINSSNSRVPPIVTGTFGGADFFHSLLGETTDKISQSSVTDLSTKMSNQNNNVIDGLKDILAKLSALKVGNGDSLNQAEKMKRKSDAYHFDPNHALPPEVVNNLKEVLKFHDDFMRGVIEKMSMIPGLTDLLDTLSNALNAFVYTTIAPYVTPVLMQVTGAIGEGSSAVISSSDQWEVFNDPNASDPTHSVLSKDHFGIILNEPAGKVAKVVVEHSVNLIVQAWTNNSNPDDVINTILEAFHHPYYSNGRSEIQKKMIGVVEQWLGDMGPSKAQETISCLTKQAVREGKNKRQGENPEGQGYSGGYSTGRQTGGSYVGDPTPQTYSSGGYQQSKSKPSSGSGGNKLGSGSYGRSDEEPYDNRQSSYDGKSYRNPQSDYARLDDNQETSYGQSGGNLYGDQKPSTHGRSDDSSYEKVGGGYGRSKDYSSSKSQSYGQTDTRSGYGRLDETRDTHHGSDNRSYESAQSTYGRSDNVDDQSSHGHSRQENTKRSYGRQDDTPYSSGKSRSDYGKTQSDYEGSDPYGRSRGGYDRSDDVSYGQPEKNSPYGGGQRSDGRPAYKSGSYGQQQEGSSGYGTVRNEDTSNDTNSNRSGYQPSYQPPGQRSGDNYSSGNPYSSGDTYSSGGGYDGSRQVDTRYATSAGNTGGHDSYNEKRSGDHGHHHKHHDDDDDGTFGARGLSLRDDDDNDDNRRGGYGGGDYNSGGYRGGR